MFDCVVEAEGKRVLTGRVVVEAPTRKANYADLERPEFIVRRNDVFARLLKRCEPLEPVSCAVAHPCDKDSLLGAIEAARRKLIVPIIVGPRASRRSRSSGVDLSPYRLVDTEHSHASAAAAAWRSRARARSRRS